MKIFEYINLSLKPAHLNKEKAHDTIRQYLKEYSAKQLSLHECLSKTGPLTADLILAHNDNLDIPNSAYDTIAILAVNYYAILYMDMYSGWYFVNKKDIYDEVSTLIEEVLTVTIKDRGLKADNPDEEVRKSRDFTNQMVNVYYRAGTEGCLKHVTSSIYSVLLYVNRNLSVKRDQIENTLRALQAEITTNAIFN